MTGKKRGGGITIQSNGVLFTEEEFAHIRECYERIRIIISVDGATREVNDRIRPGGDFARLMDNLVSLGKHREKGDIEWIQINFVVQRDNYLQMKDMVSLCERLGADQLQFIPLMRWRIPEEEYERKRMTTADGQLKEELAEVLKDPVFKSSIVYMPWLWNRMEK